MRSLVVAHRTLRAAFTLMELMVVLALIAILAAAIVPEMRGSFEDAILRSSARQWVDVFSLANTRAVSLSQTHRVRFDRATGKFFVEAQSGRASRNASFVPVRDVAPGTVDQRLGVEISRGDAPSLVTDSMEPAALPSVDSISFYPDGTADSAEVRLTDRSGAALLLRLNPVTARVQITERPLP